MKTVLLAGGLGARFREGVPLKAKLMVEIGGHPILWHVLKISSVTSEIIANFVKSKRC